MWNHTGILAQGSESCYKHDEFHKTNYNSIKNLQEGTLPKTVRTLPNIVRFSLPTNRSTRLTTQTLFKLAILTMTFGKALKNT